METGKNRGIRRDKNVFISELTYILFSETVTVGRPFYFAVFNEKNKAASKYEIFELSRFYDGKNKSFLEARDTFMRIGSSNGTRQITQIYSVTSDQ